MFTGPTLIWTPLYLSNHNMDTAIYVCLPVRTPLYRSNLIMDATTPVTFVSVQQQYGHL